MWLGAGPAGTRQQFAKREAKRVRDPLQPFAAR
jgi:hypothetical protein